jgi:hypothetical protein
MCALQCYESCNVFRLLQFNIKLNKIKQNTNEYVVIKCLPVL